jgi:hypothetical protein
VPGWSKEVEAIMPHAWQAGADRIEQTESEISSLQDDGERRRRNFEDSGAWYAGLVGGLHG